MVFCFGDSLTQGRPGISYLRFLRSAYKNRGLGGDTVIGLSGRIAPFFADQRYDTCIIEIGANDIVLPFLARLSPKWEQKVRGLAKRGSIPCTDMEQFEEIYGRLLDHVRAHHKKAAVISIPCIGEDLHSCLNAKADAYNGVIRKLCITYDIPYLDFNAWQKSLIGEGCGYFLSKDPRDVVLDTLVSTYLPFGNWISRNRDLKATVDGVHLNRTGARGLAALIETWQKSPYYYFLSAQDQGIANKKKRYDIIPQKTTR